MGITISGAGAAVHVGAGLAGDMPAGLSVDDAIYHTAHGYPGGVDALAARMRVNPGTLSHKVNPQNKTHYLRPAELVAMMLFADDASVLHAMAGALGYTIQKATPDQAGGNAVEAVMRLACAQADFLRAVADPLARMEADASAWPTGHELRRAEYMAAAVHAELDHTLATLRAHKRPEPKGADHER